MENSSPLNLSARTQHSPALDIKRPVTRWPRPSTSALLGSVGLGHLAPRLTQNEIDWETARLMKSSDLADVGMTPKRRRSSARPWRVAARPVHAREQLEHDHALGASEPVKMSTFARGVKGVDPGALVSYVTTRLGEASDVRPLARSLRPSRKKEADGAAA